MNIGYSYQPGVDTVSMDGSHRPGGQALSPQQAVKILNVRLPKGPLGGASLAPRELLQSAGAAGMPGASLNALLTALARLMQTQPQDHQTALAQVNPSHQRDGMLFPAPKYDPYVAPTPIKTSAPPRVFTEPIPPVDTTRPLTPLTPQEQPRPAYDPMPTQFDVQTLEPLPF